jgi:hypothetical protein
MSFTMSTYEEIRMPDTITAGKILMREGTELPGAMRLESEPYDAGWRLIKNLDGDALRRKIHEARWTFFCQAGDIKALTFGFDEQEIVRRAVKQILAKVEPGKFNCLEITRVAAQRFLGVPYASVSARSRHIQESVFLFEDTKQLARDGALLAAA